MSVTPEGIAKVTIDEEFNRFGAYASITLKAGGGIYITKAVYDHVNAENGNLLRRKSH